MTNYRSLLDEHNNIEESCARPAYYANYPLNWSDKRIDHSRASILFNFKLHVIYMGQIIDVRKQTSNIVINIY